MTAMLEALADQKEREADQKKREATAIRTTLALLKAGKATRAKAAIPEKLAKAIALRSDEPPDPVAEPAAPAKKRRGGRQKNVKPSKAQRRNHHRRTISERMLGMFHPNRVSTPESVRERLVADGMSVRDAAKAMRGIGALVRHDYLQKVGPSQYTRTERVYSVNGNGASTT